MKLIRHMILVEAEDSLKRGLLVNTITGTIDVLSREETALLREWEKLPELPEKPRDEEAAALWQGLSEHGFFVESEEEEARRVETELEKARYMHKRAVSESHRITFVMTYMCNFACPYCYESAITYEKRNILTKEMVDRVFELYHNDLHDITFYGGEPLQPETRSIIEYIVAKAPDATYSAVSNGYYLEEFFDLFQKLNVSNIMVTLDGPKERHNKTRKLKNGGETYDKIMAGVTLYLNHDIPIKIRMNISEANVDECLTLRDQIIAEFPEAFRKKVLMFEMQPIFQLSRQTRFALNRKIVYDKKTETGTPYQYNMIALSISPVLSRFFRSNAVIDFPRYCNCDAESTRRFYDAEGDIYSCILALRNKEATVGTYYPELTTKQESMLTRNIETVPECRDCILKLMCGGGCANVALGWGKGVMRPNCEEIRSNLYEELPALFRKYMQDE